MTRLATSLSLSVLFLAACGSNVGTGDAQNATELKPFDLMHTLPECHHDGKPDSWCTMDDAQAAAAASGMEARVKAMIDRATDKERSKIVIAYFSFSNKAVFNALCDKGKQGFSIEGFFDQSYRTQMPAQLAQNCQGPSGKNVVVHFLGAVDTNVQPIVWRLHHNKFLIVDPGDDSPISLNFSSGNLSSFGLSVHFDHWAVLSVARDSNAMRMHDCVIEALRKAINPNGRAVDEEVDDPDAYRDYLNQCLVDNNTFYQSGTSWVEQAITAEKIAPLFSPDPSNSNAKILMQQINRVKAGGKIYGAMQHFLHGGIASALASAVQRGVDVRLIMDNDVMSGEGEVPGVKEFYESQLNPAETGINIRFLVTNATDHQMMHNKFLVMEGVDGSKNRVFSGAGHFTSSGLRNNYENFYLSQSDVLSGKYKALFDYMWPRTVDEATASNP